MKAKIISIRNSRVICIPKSWLHASNLENVDEVEVLIKKRGLFIQGSERGARDKWADAFKRMAHHKDDHLLIPDDFETLRYEIKTQN
jgi:antitoxin component of MazEF toxin-antitoxin module